MKSKSLITIFLLLLIGCSNSNDGGKDTFKNKLDSSVDLWTSVQYEVITDNKIINDIDKPIIELDKPEMIHILVRTINKGKTRANKVSLNLIEPTPYIHLNGTGSGGVDHGYLDKNEEYEYSYTYTFKNESDLHKFITESNIKVEWTENDTKKEQYIKLASKPIQ
jgi:hypothetical protein